MGDIIRTDRFPKARTSKERERLRAKFARRPISATKRRKDVKLPDKITWQR